MTFHYRPDTTPLSLPLPILNPLCPQATVLLLPLSLPLSLSLSLSLSLPLNPSLPPSLSLTRCFPLSTPSYLASFSLYVCIPSIIPTPLSHSAPLAYSSRPESLHIHSYTHSKTDPRTKLSLLSFPSLQSQATHQSMAGCPQPVRRSSAAESASKQSTNEQTARTAAAPPPHLRSKSPTPIIPVPHRTSHDMYNNPLYKFKLPATHSPVHNSVLHSCSPHKTGQNTPIKATPYT